MKVKYQKYLMNIFSNTLLYQNNSILDNNGELGFTQLKIRLDVDHVGLLVLVKLSLID
jgi:hypothetical protein